MDQGKSPLHLGPLENLTVSVSDRVLSQELEGQTVLLDLNSESYYGLNRLGSRIWSLLQEGHQPEEICRALLQEYPVEGSALQEDVTAFLSQLHQEGIIQAIYDSQPSA